MRSFVVNIILFSSVLFSQEVSTGNILEDHDKAVAGILSEEIKKQTEIVNEALTKQSNDVLFAQATYSFLGIIGTIIMEGNSTNNPINFIPLLLGHTIVPVLEMKEINESKEPESLKKMRKARFFQKDAYISVDFLTKKCEVVKMKDAPETPGDFDMILQNAEGVKKQIYFDNPSIPENNSILDELESFAEAINNNRAPEVTLHDGTEALRVANQIIDCF